MISNGQVILSVEDLQTHFFVEEGTLRAVEGLSLEVLRGEVLGLVGESGCGKTVASLSILRLVDPPGEIVGGVVTFDGVDLTYIEEKQLEEIRGRRISMIFQQPQASLNPVKRIGRQIAEVLQVHLDMSKAESREAAEKLLQQVGIADPEARSKSYPHELSGGMAQRVMIAIALACSPDLVIADEPTTALDVTIQAQILDLLRERCAVDNTAVMLISHDLDLVAEIADRIAVMYAGHVVEQATTDTLHARPLHPYTRGLIDSMPVLGEHRERLDVIPGAVPIPIDLPQGCRFAPRCQARVDHELDVCTQLEPQLKPIEPDHEVRCWLYHNSPLHLAPLYGLDT